MLTAYVGTIALILKGPSHLVGGWWRVRGQEPPWYIEKTVYAPLLGLTFLAASSAIGGQELVTGRAIREVSFWGRCSIVCEMCIWDPRPLHCLEGLMLLAHLVNSYPNRQLQSPPLHTHNNTDARGQGVHHPADPFLRVFVHLP